MAPIVFAVAGWQAVLLCLLFAVIYVGSLYIWADSVNRNRYENSLRETALNYILCIYKRE